MEFLNLSSVELLPNAKASAAFTVDSSKVFKEQQDIPPVVIDEGPRFAQDSQQTD